MVTFLRYLPVLDARFSCHHSAHLRLQRQYDHAYAGRTLTYDGENRPLSVTTLGGVLTTYEYGADDKRLKKVENVGTQQQSTTFYFGDHEIRDFGQDAGEIVITRPHPNVRLVKGTATRVELSLNRATSRKLHASAVHRRCPVVS